MTLSHRTLGFFSAGILGLAAACGAETANSAAPSSSASIEAPHEAEFIQPSATNNTSSDGARLAARISNASENATLIVPEGVYDVTDIKIRRSLTLKGMGNVVLFSSKNTAKGILNPLPGVSLTVENITFYGARSPDLNGAGIRHDGRDLTIISCKFINNENGVLATGNDEGVIAISNASFIANGHGDGYSHGIYLSSGDTLTITKSLFKGTKIGHHIKSLARATSVSKTILDDADGQTSYAIDVSKGGAVTIFDNKFIQAADADNAVMINYDLSRGGKATQLRINNNQVINFRRNGYFLRNGASSLRPELQNNTIENKSGGAFSLIR